MKGGRNILKRASKGNDTFTLLPGQTIMRVVSLRGSNLIEVILLWLMKVGEWMLSRLAEKWVVLFLKFFIMNKFASLKSLPNVVNGEGSSRLISSIIEKSFHLSRPAIFSSARQEVCNEVPSSDLLHEDNEVDSSDDDGLPPLEVNMNRTRPAELLIQTRNEVQFLRSHSFCRNFKCYGWSRSFQQFFLLAGVITVSTLE